MKNLLFIIIVFYNISTSAQSLNNISFGTTNSLDVITWNLEWFAKNGQITIDSLSVAINALDAEIYAIQEIDDVTEFNSLLNLLPNYSGYYAGSYLRLGYIYKTNLTITSTYTIYSNSTYNFASRAPIVMEFLFNSEDFIIINTHFKCCGDGILDLNNSSDEEFRRYSAMNMIKQYIDQNHSNKNVIVLGDFNDVLSDSYSNNVFQQVINDSQNYVFTDMAIANGSSANWSYPNWPSHLDHILITNELFDEFNNPNSKIETIRIENYFSGGFSQYDAIISDHLPVGLSLSLGTFGCTDSAAINYNPTATIDDGSCLYCIYGCTNSLANNYNVFASCDDGSCTYPPISLSAVITNVSCNGNTDGSIDLTVSGGLPPYTYSWSNNANIQDITNITSGTYSVLVTDALGQMIIDSFIVLESSVIIINTVVTNESSVGASDGSIDISVSGGLPPYSYYWNTIPSQTTEDISGLSAGDYIVFVGYNNWACFVSDTVTVSVGSSVCNKPTPTGIFASEIIDVQAKVNWDDMNTATCLVDQLRIQYREVGTTTWSQRNAVGSGLCVFGLGTTSKVVFNLSPATTYEYRIKSWYCNTTGSSTWSAIQTFTTLSACPNVINLAVNSPTTTKATFTWNTAGAYSFVRIKLRVDTTASTWLTAGGFGVNYPALTKNKNGLTPGTSYRASSRTWCDPAGGRYKASAWTPFIFWTQPVGARMENPNLIDRKLLRVTDVLGRKVNPKTIIDKSTLFYIYSDGTVEKKIIIEQ